MGIDHGHSTPGLRDPGGHPAEKSPYNENLNIPNEVLLFIADQVNTNIRELEGRLYPGYCLRFPVGKKISVELAREALKDIIYNRDRDQVLPSS
jgi:chromosomal replication initiator protein